MTNHCQFPVEDRDDRPCGQQAAWTTDDLQEVRFLCDAHCSEALILNDFIADRVDA